MCGLAGEFSFSSPVQYSVIKDMIATLVHRGPDDEGIFCQDKIGLGHRRLSIIDLSTNGRQPMWAEDGSLAIVFNGEVYNHREIRNELSSKGYKFNSDTDTEVVLNSIHFWGILEAINRFNGMFAFAIWNNKEQELYLVRDRLGVKPLYFQKTSERIIFGSELRALYAHPEFKSQLSSATLEEFFCFGYTLNERTVFSGSKKVPSGSYLRVKSDGREELHKYWSIDQIDRSSFQGSFGDAQEALIELCESSFNYRLVSDVPVGVFLSGGIDSTFLAANLKSRIGVNLDHMTVGFEEDAFDETKAAASVAEGLDLKHSLMRIGPSEAQDALSEFVEIWDEPFGDTSGIPTSILCRKASEHFKVVLSADGGDELFCGYDSYANYQKRYTILDCIPLSLRQLLATKLKSLPYQKILSSIVSSRESSWNPQTIARFEKAMNLLEITGEHDLIRIMNEKGWDKNTVTELIDYTDSELDCELIAATPSYGVGGDELIDKMMRTDLNHFLGEDVLTKVDRASMWNSLECREPMLDHRLVEFAFSLPLNYIYKDGVHKLILKQILKPIVGPNILNSPKRGFSIPLYSWLRGPWKSLVHDFLSPTNVRKIGILNERVVCRELEMFYKFNGGRAEKIMLMLNFHMWAERWLNR